LLQLIVLFVNFHFLQLNNILLISFIFYHLNYLSCFWFFLMLTTSNFLFFCHLLDS